jgi:hypothetical protein
VDALDAADRAVAAERQRANEEFVLLEVRLQRWHRREDSYVRGFAIVRLTSFVADRWLRAPSTWTERDDRCRLGLLLLSHLAREVVP